MVVGPSYNSAAPFLARSPLTPNMSDVRSETGYSPSPKLAPTDASLKAVVMRDSQLMTPPFSPAKVGDVVLPRSGDDSLAFYLSKTGVDGPLFPDDASTLPTMSPAFFPPPRQSMSTLCKAEESNASWLRIQMSQSHKACCRW